MTSEEAKQVGLIAMTADGECTYCAHDLISQLMRAFPDNRLAFEEAWATEYDRPWSDKLPS